MEHFQCVHCPVFDRGWCFANDRISQINDCQSFNFNKILRNLQLNHTKNHLIGYEILFCLISWSDATANWEICQLMHVPFNQCKLILNLSRVGQIQKCKNSIFPFKLSTTLAFIEQMNWVFWQLTLCVRYDKSLINEYVLISIFKCSNHLNFKCLL